MKVMWAFRVACRQHVQRFDAVQVWHLSDSITSIEDGQDPSRMRSEGFSFNSGGLEVGVVFAQCCFGVRNRSQPSATVGFEVAKPRRSQNVTKSCVVGRFRRK